MKAKETPRATVIRIGCDCGRALFLAASGRFPALLTLAAGPEAALRELGLAESSKLAGKEDESENDDARN